MSYFKDNILNIFFRKFNNFFLKHFKYFFSQYIRMDHVRHQKYKNKQLKNSTLELDNEFKLINISINDMDELLN